MVDLSHSAGPDLIPEPDEYALAEWLRSHEPQGRDGRAMMTAWQSPDIGLIYRKTVYWTDRFLNAFRPVRGLLVRTVSGLNGLSVGYHDPETESDGFGIILHVKPNSGGLLRRGSLRFHSGVPVEFLADILMRVERDHYTESRTSELQRLMEDLRFTNTAMAPFRVVIREAAEHLDSLARHPYSGTAAGYVTTRTGSPEERPGLLTCKHVVASSLGKDPQIGDPVPMADGDLDRALIDLAPNPIDAAVLEADASELTTPLPVMPHVAQYLPVDIRTASGQTKANRVTAVTDTYNVWDDPDIPAFLELEKPGASGDSGALVMDQATGAAVGLYRGRFDAPVPLRRSGRAAHLRQVKALMGLELYE